VEQSSINRLGWLAVGLAILGSLVAAVNEIVRFRATGAVNWGHVALIFAVPIIMFNIVSSTKRTSS
jgi:hypothetical protein